MKEGFLRGRERRTVAFRAVGNISVFEKGTETKLTLRNQTRPRYITAVKILKSLEESTAC